MNCKKNIYRIDWSKLRFSKDTIVLENIPMTVLVWFNACRSYCWNYFYKIKLQCKTQLLNNICMLLPWLQRILTNQIIKPITTYKYHCSYQVVQSYTDNKITLNNRLNPYIKLKTT